MSCFEQCPPCEGCVAKDKEIAALRAALRKIAKLAANRAAMMLLGPRAFAQAERIARAALAADAEKGG